MPWGKVDDTMYDHPKVEPLTGDLEGLAALGLWALALSYANRYLTDGALLPSRPRALAAMLEPETVDRLASRLVEAGLWERRGDGGFTIHDFLEFNESRADVLARREADADRMRKYREGRRAARNGERTPERSGERKAERSGERSTERNGERSPGVAPFRARASRPGPSHTVDVLEKGSPHDARPRAEAPARSPAAAPGPAPAREGPGRPREPERANGGTGDPWATFGPEWSEFRVAWEGRGLRLPPAGEAGDDPEAEHPSQRALLWGIVNDAPTLAAQWVGEAKGTRSFEVIGHVLTQWHARRAAVEVLEVAGAAGGPSRDEAAAMLAELSTDG